MACLFRLTQGSPPSVSTTLPFTIFSRPQCRILVAVLLLTLGFVGGPKDHLNRRILHSDSKAQDKGIPETTVCRMLVFKGPFGPRSFCFTSGLCEAAVPGLSCRSRGSRAQALLIDEPGFEDWFGECNSVFGGVMWLAKSMHHDSHTLNVICEAGNAMALKLAPVSAP